ncbi:MAG: DUF1574 domain-containing protein [Synechococcales cyanobacterium C42_A2020_086]|jgi:hypothetical protein|nr:DUF1574 domain-containing protein [Synechococcales cyanobacterium C42_A2020_086]
MYQTIALRGWGVQYRIRGNSLHILCQGNPAPDRSQILHAVIPALQSVELNTLLPADQPPLYQVWLYGCPSGQKRPTWTTTLYLNQLDQHQAALQSVDANPATPSDEPHPPLTVHPPAPSAPPADTAALTLSNRALAKRGQEMAIACYLSETLNELGVAVRVSAKAVPYTPPAAVQLASDPISATQMTKRLWVACEAAYSPEPSLLAEPITRKLRELEIEGFRDAVIRFQVAGEARPDWLLRVDLTPPQEMLREWGRWGDVEAIRCLLNQDLQHLRLQISTASLSETTLHLCCSPLAAPPNDDDPDPVIEYHKRAKAEIALLLEGIAPQGIHAAMVYGHRLHQDTPAWVEWLDLPAAHHPALAASTLELAQQGDWAALAFLLHRLLNPNLKQCLTTGGIRLQLLPKQDLLHIMTEASQCPERQQVAPVIAKFLKPLQVPNLVGVRIYGRRAGQKTPLWSYGLDFVTRQRLVPEVTPEFAATAAHVEDLIPDAGEPVLRPDLTPADLVSAWSRLQQRWMHATQQLLLRSQLFTPIVDSQTTALVLPGQHPPQGIKVALIWGAAGLLLMLQANWLLDKALRTPPDAPSTPPAEARQSIPPVTAAAPSPQPSPLVRLPESPRSGADVGTDIFDARGFTRSPEPPEPVAESGSSPVKLPYTQQSAESALVMAAFLAEGSPLPTFNSRQLDEKLQLYYRFIEEYAGPPDVMIVGSSRALRGVDPMALQDSLAQLGYPDATVFNFGINGATAQVVNLLVQQILTPEQLPRLILWADGARAFNSGTVDVTYNGILVSEAYRQLQSGQLAIPRSADAEPVSPAPGSLNTTLTESYQSLDRWLSDTLGRAAGTHPQRDRLKRLAQDTLTAWMPDAPTIVVPSGIPSTPQANTPQPALPISQAMLDEYGFLSLPVQFNPATYYQKYARVLGEYDSDYENFQLTGRQDEALRSLLQFTSARQIPVIFVNLPLTEDYLDPFRLQYEQDFREYMVRTSLSQPGFTFRDLSEAWTTQYSYFSDPSHLNRYGAYAVSRRLAQDPIIPWSESKSSTAPNGKRQSQISSSRLERSAN